MESFVFCSICKRVYEGWEMTKDCSDHGKVGMDFPGVIVKEFLTSEESEKLLDGVDNSLGWDASQSGRRKKNYGPKVNFKKKKLSLGQFIGFPAITDFVRQRLQDISILHDFQTVEECFLEYDSSRGSHIDPHIDDCWIWGERVVTINIDGCSVLTLRKHTPTYPQQYNLDLVEEYKNKLLEPMLQCIDDNVVIRIPMPARSIVILYGPARYQYEHAVLREDIVSRRVAIAYREFTIPYQKGNDKYQEAENIYKLCDSSTS
jgi:DNA N6-methyl adenine demethylase